MMIEVKGTEILKEHPSYSCNHCGYTGELNDFLKTITTNGMRCSAYNGCPKCNKGLEITPTQEKKNEACCTK